MGCSYAIASVAKACRVEIYDVCVMLKLIMMSVLLRASRLSKNYACIYAYLGGVVG